MSNIAYAGISAPDGGIATVIYTVLSESAVVANNSTTFPLNYGDTPEEARENAASAVREQQDDPALIVRFLA